MEVKLLEGRYDDSLTEYVHQKPGDVITVSDDEGARLIEAGSAEAVALKPSQRRETRASR